MIDGRKSLPKVDAAAYVLLDCKDWGEHEARLEDFRLFTETLSLCSKDVSLMLLPIRYKLYSTVQVHNQLVMDLIAAAHFAGFHGMTGHTLYGLVITADTYIVYAAPVVRTSVLIASNFSRPSIVQVERPSPMEITRYEQQPISTFADFVRLFFLLTDLRNLLYEQFKNEFVEESRIVGKPSWRRGADGSHGGSGSKPGDNGGADGQDRGVHAPTPVRAAPAPGFMHESAIFAPGHWESDETESSWRLHNT